MSKTANTTVADVVAQATDEKLVTTVPTQQKDTDVTAAEQTETTNTDGEKLVKRTAGQRLDAMIEKMRENKKTLLAVGAGVAFATAAVIKLAKKQAEQVVLETVVPEAIVEDVVEDENTGDESAV